MDVPLDLVVDSTPDALYLAFLEEQLATAAVDALGIGAERDSAILFRDRGRLAAGVSGTIWRGCCQVHVLWVEEELRGRGLARTLMAGAEAEAKRQGCRLLMGLAYEVLTSDFYDRLGYSVVGEIDDCPAGTTTRWYRKDL